MRILIVEDEIMARRGLADLIRRIDPAHEIVGLAANAQAGLSQIRALSPDITFVDIRMPQMDGLEMIEEAFRQGVTATFVIISAFAEFSYAQKALSLGVREYLLKPVTYEDVDAVLKKLCPAEAPSCAIAAHPMVARALAYLHEHYADHLSLEHLSTLLQITPEYLSYLFRRDTGITFSTYLRNYRVGKACELMDHGLARVYEVAQAVGFSDAKYFNRVFRESTGISPGTYLKQRVLQEEREREG